jgi:hypothetical protein
MLNPLLLWLLPLAAVPVLLHLLNLHRLREVELPTYRFLMEGYVQQRRRLRLVEWLLMLLRTAVVALLVTALARPVVERVGGLFGGRGGRDVVFVVDAGLTTGLITDGLSSLHRIRAAVEAAIGRLRDDDFVTLVRAGIEPRVLHRGVRGDGQRIAAELASLEPDPGTADLAAAVGLALAGPPRGPRTVWIVSDCEERAWRRLGDRPVATRIPADVRLVVADLGGGAAPVRNLALLGDPPRAQRPLVGLPVELRVRVAAAGFAAATDTKATVTLDDEVVAQVPLVVPQEGEATALVPLVPARAGVLRGRVTLPADAFPQDDILHFVLNAEPRVGVLIVAPGGLEPLADPALFLRTALESPRGASRDAATAADPTGAGDAAATAASLVVTVARADALTEAQVRDADVILMVDAPLDGRRVGWIRDRVEAGRAGLMLLAGSHGRGGGTAALFARRPAIAFGEPTGDPDAESSARSPGTVDHSHPVFASLAPLSDRAATAVGRDAPLDTLVVFRCAPLVLPGPDARTAEPAAATTVLARLDDGTPVVVETLLGRGRVLACGVPATPDWSNLPVHPAFVPLLLRSVQHLRPDPPAVAAESIRAGEPAPVRVSQTWRRAVVQAIGPGTRRRALDLVAGDAGASGVLDDTLAPGTYEFDIEPPADVQAAPLRLGTAVNPDVETASFRHLAAADLTTLLAPHEFTHLAGTTEDPTLHATLAGRREIWRPLIVLVFVMFAIEFLLGTLRPPQPTGSGEPPGGRTARFEAWLARIVGNTAAPETA